jgi:histidine kinase/histidine kinase/DNA gyrase B/HSP90-like ATPase
MTADSRASTRTFVAILLAWTAMAALGTFQLVIAYRAKSAMVGAPMLPVWRLALFQLAVWWYWIPVTMVALALSRVLPLDRGGWRRRLTATAAHVAVGIPVAVVHGLLYQHADRLASGYNPEPRMLALYYVGTTFFTVLFDGIVYAAIVGAITMRSYARRYRDRDLKAAQLEQQLTQAKLSALQMQLNPHFLFNALSSVTQLIRRDAKSDAIDLVVGFSELLRQSLASSNDTEVPLSQELQFTRRYLEIEQVRFADRLHTGVHIAPNVEHALVPRFILQPLVENALRHGVADEEGQIDVLVRGVARGQHLVLSVEDSGAGLSSTSPRSGAGFGLVHTRQRLSEAYGQDASLELRSRTGGGAIAEVVLPLVQPLGGVSTVRSA